MGDRAAIEQGADGAQACGPGGVGEGERQGPAVEDCPTCRGNEILDDGYPCPDCDDPCDAEDVY